MKTPLTAASLNDLRNPVFRNYAARYVRIYDDFLAQVRSTGIELDPVDHAPEVAERLSRLRAAPRLQVRNDAKSLALNGLSPACVACQTSQGSATFFVSLECRRDCYFCFNPNQEHYDYYTTHLRDPLPELDALRVRASGQALIPYIERQFQEEEDQLAFRIRKDGPDLVESIADETTRLAKDNQWEPADLKAALDKAGVPPEAANAIVAENSTARLDALRSSLSVLALIALLATFLTFRIPEAAAAAEPAPP